MRTLVHPAATAREPTRVVALLTGSYSEPEDFVREGFEAAALASQLPAELVLAEMRATWFADGSIVDRIRATIVEPARRRGITDLWLGGISLGALSVMAYAARREADVRGLLLLAPYPATREVLLEIDMAGGLDAWQPAIPPEGDLEREAWQWLRSRPAPRLPVHLRFGSEDRFASAQRRIGAALDPRLVHELPGGHDWATWRRCWDAFLADSCKVPA